MNTYIKILAALVVFVLLLGCIGGGTPNAGDGTTVKGPGTTVSSAKLNVEDADLVDPEDPVLDVSDLSMEDLETPE